MHSFSGRPGSLWSDPYPASHGILDRLSLQKVYPKGSLLPIPFSTTFSTNFRKSAQNGGWPVERMWIN